MTLGKAIQIYLPKGDATGIKICDINTSFVKGILIPRNELKDIYSYEDLTVPGIYFLITEIEEESSFIVYIGEAENLFKRFKDHNNNKKRDWNKIVAFISSKNNLNKAHYKFLEHHCYEVGQSIGRFEIENKTFPSNAQLTPADRDLALHFFEDLKVIMGTLGFPIFEEIKEKRDILYGKTKNAMATGEFTNEGFVVYRDSTASALESTKAVTLGVHSLRKKLKSERILIIKDNLLIFTKDYLFGSPSAAASAIMGSSMNGWKFWRNKEGKTLDEIKRLNNP
jgi:hypothetical protein